MNLADRTIIVCQSVRRLHIKDVRIGKNMKQLLEKLNYYRNFPRFQLERHFDVILIDYIPQIINYFNHTNYSVVFPEFPVRKKLLIPNNKSEWESVAFDYALFDKINKRIGIVELKTETESNDKIQDDYLSKLMVSVSCKDLIKFVRERKEYKKGDKKTRKYEFLYKEMYENECVNFFKDSEELILTYKISPHNLKLNNSSYYSFEKIANEVQISDKNWPLLCEYLKKWNKGL